MNYTSSEQQDAGDMRLLRSMVEQLQEQVSALSVRVVTLEDIVAKQSSLASVRSREPSPRKQPRQGKRAQYTEIDVLGKGGVATVSSTDDWKLTSARVEVDMLKQLQSVGGHDRM